jgi:hypothetical protein
VLAWRHGGFSEHNEVSVEVEDTEGRKTLAGYRLRSFIAGAVAIQLLYSNFVFWLEAFADTPKGHACLGRLPTWLRSIRHMLHPAGHLTSNDTVNVKWAKDVLEQLFPTDGATIVVKAGTVPGVVAKNDDGETSHSRKEN